MCNQNLFTKTQTCLGGRARPRNTSSLRPDVYYYAARALPLRIRDRVGAAYGRRHHDGSRQHDRVLCLGYMLLRVGHVLWLLSRVV